MLLDTGITRRAQLVNRDLCENVLYQQNYTIHLPPLTMGLIQTGVSKVQTDGVRKTLYSALQKPHLLLINSDVGKLAAHSYANRKNPISVNGIELDVSFDVVHSQIPRLIYGDYEEEIIHYITTYLQKDVDVVELGGGIGFVSCNVDAHLDDRKQIVVEPNPSILPVLKRNRDLNESTFEILETAYDPTGTPVELSVSGFNTASTKRDRGEITEVESSNLSDIISEFDIDEFNLIVDIEGAETQLIKSELNTILKHCPYVIIEFHGFEDIIDEVEMVKERINATELEIVDRRSYPIEKIIYKNPKFTK